MENWNCKVSGKKYSWKFLLPEVDQHKFLDTKKKVESINEKIDKLEFIELRSSLWNILEREKTSHRLR